MIRLLLLCMYLPFVGIAQQYHPYDTVVMVEGSKSELYSRAKEAIANMFKQPDKVIVLDDKEAGKIILKCSTHDHSGNKFLNGFYTFSITYEFKDGRFRCHVYGVAHSRWGSLERPVPLLSKKPELKDIFSNAYIGIGTVVGAINSGICSTQKKDW